MKRRLFVASVLVALLVVLASSCKESVDSHHDVVVTGTVKLVAVGGGCWVIDTDDGKGYELTNLPSEFRVEGLSVRARIRLEPDLLSTCMVAPIASVVEIEQVGR